MPIPPKTNSKINPIIYHRFNFANDQPAGKTVPSLPDPDLENYARPRATLEDILEGRNKQLATKLALCKRLKAKHFKTSVYHGEIDERIRYAPQIPLTRETAAYHRVKFDFSHNSIDNKQEEFKKYSHQSLTNITHAEIHLPSGGTGEHATHYKKLLSSLTTAKHLQSLSLSSHANWNPENDGFLLSMSRLLRFFPKLTEIKFNLGSNAFSVPAIKTLIHDVTNSGRLSSIYLDLSSSQNINDDVLTYASTKLKTLGQLKEIAINFDYCGMIQDAGIVSLSSTLSELTNLENFHLGIRQTRGTDVSMEHLARVFRDSEKMTHFSVAADGTPLTLEGLKHMCHAVFYRDTFGDPFSRFAFSALWCQGLEREATDKFINTLPLWQLAEKCQLFL